MFNSRVRLRVRRNARKKKLVEKAIRETLSKEGIVVSRATTVEEICSVANYNRSVEFPICGKGKLKVY